VVTATAGRMMGQMADGQTGEWQFGSMLRIWRNTRRLSQLDLALASDVSARHISFLETGRARPSRSMVIHLAEFLHVPHTDRNALLNAAGFAPAYRARTLDEEAMQPVDQAVNWMLERHAPFPAIVLDRHWNIVRTNAPATTMLSAAGIGTGEDMLALFGNPVRLQTLIDNWQQVARHMVLRLRTEALHFGGDSVLSDAADRLETVLGGRDMPANGTMPPFVPIRFRLGEATLSLFSAISQFGSAEDIALADWKLELFFPADNASRQMLTAMAGA